LHHSRSIPYPVFAKIISIIFIILVLAPSGGMLTVSSQESPPPAAIYGNVSILCQANGTVFDAPAGLGIRAFYPNGTLAAENTTGEGGSASNQYTLQVSGEYSGTIDLYVESVYVGSVEVSSGAVVRFDILVNETEPPSPPAGISVSPPYAARPTISWNSSTDNLKVNYYIIELYGLNNGLLYNETTANTSWAPPEGLSDGIYTANISAVDLSCNRGPDGSVEFIVDTTPPSISVHSPVEGGLYNALPIIVNATVIDELSGVDSDTIQVLLDNESLEYSYMPATGSLITI
jgi:hypothetical protein